MFSIFLVSLHLYIYSRAANHLTHKLLTWILIGYEHHLLDNRCF